jgi:hypothetical protein
MVFSLFVKSQFTQEGMPMVREAIITIVDLAGSENLGQSQSESGKARAEVRCAILAEICARGLALSVTH